MVNMPIPQTAWNTEHRDSVLLWDVPYGFKPYTFVIGALDISPYVIRFEVHVSSSRFAFILAKSTPVFPEIGASKEWLNDLWLAAYRPIAIASLGDALQNQIRKRQQMLFSNTPYGFELTSWEENQFSPTVTVNGILYGNSGILRGIRP